MTVSRFKDKVVWITGASSGIGEALACAFSRRGARLILSARREAELERVAGHCQGEADRARILPLDLSRVDTLGEKASEARRCFGRVDVMIHNGGVSHQDLVTNTGLDVDRTIMETNYFGTVALTKALLPSMVADGGGHFVVVGSLSGKFGVPRLSAYAASKHALHGFFESLRAEVTGENIRITIVIPGVIRTPITVNALTGDGTPHGKMTALHEKGMSPEECAERIVRAVAREREEALIGGKETLTVTFHRLFPGLFNRVIRNHPVRRWRKLTGKPGGGE